MLRQILPVVFVTLALAVTLPGLLERRPAPRPAPHAAAAVAAAADPATERDDVPGRAVIDADAAGHYRAQVRVDDRLLDMIVDTGASTVVLRYEDAERLGLAGDAAAFDVKVMTANGEARAARVTLDSVGIGGITLYAVPALVAAPGALGINLLGMSALRRLSRVEARQGQLVLEN
ncbi:MAG TPA: TIGR02281 family clan AA aspartic protease [Hyphomicrobiales bacterium]|nr:TIGR02281 family clan AA aspartic protease [Hyphomicrobiales bacterium]